MKRKPILLNETEQERVKLAIAEAEKKTSGEIAVLFCKSSADYRWVPLLWGSIGWFVTSLFLYVVETRSLIPFGLGQVLFCQSMGALTLGLISLWGPVFRLTVPEKTRRLLAERESLANFLAMGLPETTDRAGVLIYVSEKEHEIVLLADRGIHGKAGEQYWAGQSRRIAEGFRRGKGCELLCEVIGEIGDTLASHFPIKPGDKNQIPDTPHLGPQEYKP